MKRPGKMAELAAQIRDAITAGRWTTQEEFAEPLGVTRAYIGLVIKKYGVQVPPRNQAPTPQDVAAWQARAVSTEELANRLEVSVDWLRQWLRTRSICRVGVVEERLSRGVARCCTCKREVPVGEMEKALHRCNHCNRAVMRRLRKLPINATPEVSEMWFRGCTVDEIAASAAMTVSEVRAAVEWRGDRSKRESRLRRGVCYCSGCKNELPKDRFTACFWAAHYGQCRECVAKVGRARTEARKAKRGG